MPPKKSKQKSLKAAAASVEAREASAVTAKLCEDRRKEKKLDSQRKRRDERKSIPELHAADQEEWQRQKQWSRSPAKVMNTRKRVFHKLSEKELELACSNIDFFDKQWLYAALALRRKRSKRERDEWKEGLIQDGYSSDASIFDSDSTEALGSSTSDDDDETVALKVTKAFTGKPPPSASELEMIAAREAEQREPLAEFKGSVSIFREQQQMIGEDHRAHFINVGRNDSTSRRLCNNVDCYCRGGLKMEAYSCPSKYWSRVGGFNSRAQKLKSLVGKLSEIGDQHAQSIGYYFPLDLLKPDYLGVRSACDTWQYHVPTDHTCAEWAEYSRQKHEYLALEAAHSKGYYFPLDPSKPDYMHLVACRNSWTTHIRSSHTKGEWSEHHEQREEFKAAAGSWVYLDASYRSLACQKEHIDYLLDPSSYICPPN